MNEPYEEKKVNRAKKYYKTLPDLPCGGLDRRGTIVMEARRNTLPTGICVYGRR